MPGRRLVSGMLPQVRVLARLSARPSTTPVCSKRGYRGSKRERDGEGSTVQLIERRCVRAPRADRRRLPGAVHPAKCNTTLSGARVLPKCCDDTVSDFGCGQHAAVDDGNASSDTAVRFLGRSNNVYRDATAMTPSASPGAMVTLAVSA